MTPYGLIIIEWESGNVKQCKKCDMLTSYYNPLLEGEVYQKCLLPQLNLHEM